MEHPRVGVSLVPGPGEGLVVIQGQQGARPRQRAGHRLLPPLQVPGRVRPEPQELLQPPQDAGPGREWLQREGQDTVKRPGEALRGPAQERGLADAAGAVEGEDGAPSGPASAHQRLADVHQFPVAAEEAGLRHGQRGEVHRRRGRPDYQPLPLRQAELRQRGPPDVEDGRSEGQAAVLGQERGVVEEAQPVAGRVGKERRRLLRGQGQVGQGEAVAGLPVCRHSDPAVVGGKRQSQHRNLRGEKKTTKTQRHEVSSCLRVFVVNPV